MSEAKQHDWKDAAGGGQYCTKCGAIMSQGHDSRHSGPCPADKKESAKTPWSTTGDNLRMIRECLEAFAVDLRAASEA